VIASQGFPPKLSSVAAARRFVREQLGDDAAAPARDAVELMVSELATNSVKHARAAFTVTIERDGEEIRVQVHDAGIGRPVAASPGLLYTTGRGLQIVELLSSRWGVIEESGGKTVWFTLRTSAAAPALGEREHAEPEARRATPAAGAGAGGGRAATAPRLAGTRSAGSRRPRRPSARTTSSARGAAPRADRR
jgi:anti-sigma regulatory factor (Ser/Thr protein kinase)